MQLKSTHYCFSLQRIKAKIHVVQKLPRMENEGKLGELIFFRIRQTVNLSYFKTRLTRCRGVKVSYKLAGQANGEDGCCHLVKGIVSCLRAQENSCLITISHSSEYLTSLSELFQWQLVRFLSGLAFGHLLQSGTSQNATLQKRQEGHPIPLVTVIRQAVYKCCHRCGRNKTTWRWSKISVAKLLLWR